MDPSLLYLVSAVLCTALAAIFAAKASYLMVALYGLCVFLGIRNYFNPSKRGEYSHFFATLYVVFGVLNVVAGVAAISVHKGGLSSMLIAATCFVWYAQQKNLPK